MQGRESWDDGRLGLDFEQGDVGTAGIEMTDRMAMARSAEAR